MRPWRLAVHPTDPQLLPRNTNLFQAAEDLARHSGRQIDKAVVIANIHVTDVTAFQTGLVGNRTDDVTGLHPVGVPNLQPECLVNEIVAARAAIALGRSFGAVADTALGLADATLGVAHTVLGVADTAFRLAHAALSAPDHGRRAAPLGRWLIRQQQRCLAVQKARQGCRDLERGSPECLGELTAKADRPRLALLTGRGREEGAR